MNFVQDGAEPSKIIKSYKKVGKTYVVNYFDDSYSQYESLEENEEDRIRNIMISQALERSNNYNIKEVFASNRLGIVNTLLSVGLLSCSLYSKKQLVSILSIAALTYSLKCLSDNAQKIKELKKYKLFFELMNDLEFVNSSSMLKCVEFDNFYQTRLDINTLDDYSYNQVKTIYKNYIKVKK